MADPVKPLNRLKPFTRINNESSIPAKAPDGNGVACGCHTPEEFGNFSDKFKEFLKRNLAGFGPLVQFLEDLNKIAKTAADIINTAKAVLVPAAAALGGALGAGVASLLTALAAAATVVGVVSDIVSKVTDVIDTAIRGFIENIGEELAKEAIRVVPQWVPVQVGASNERITPDQIKDIEGIVTRSYCDPIEPPFFQWHRWLNWSIQVTPEDRYKTVLVDGFELNTEGKKAGETPVVRKGTFDIQWDGGAMWTDSPIPKKDFVGEPAFESGLTDDQIPDVEGPFTSSVSPDRIDPKKRAPSNWIWPTTGMYVWAAGRLVYDCSRTDKITGSDQKMISMMNPPRAIATATWEAVQFTENLPGDPNDQQATKVPAIRFLFFACKRGGYLSYDSLADEDYEFILDLPPAAVPVSPFPIGHTPDFPHNTIVFRPRLLSRLDPLVGIPEGAKPLKPIITVLPPPADKPGAAPQQVKVTVRGKDIGNADARGFILSLGWFDPNRTQAATVKDCIVKFNQFEGLLSPPPRDSPVDQVKNRFKKQLDKLKQSIDEKVLEIKVRSPIPPFPLVTLKDLFDNAPIVGTILKDAINKAVNAAVDGVINLLAKLVAGTQTEEWLLNIGVNGHWQTRFFGSVTSGITPIRDPYEFKFSLGPDDLLFFASNGIEFNPVGDMMLAARNNRLLKRNDKDNLTWSVIASAKGSDHQDIVFHYALNVLIGNSSGKMALGIENSPLGLIEPGDFSKPGTDPASSNPLAVKNVNPRLVNLTPLPLAKFAESTLEIPNPQDGKASSDEPILLEDPSRNDYRLTGIVNIQKQIATS